MKKISVIVLVALLLSLWPSFSLKVNAKTEVTILGGPTKMLVDQSEEYEYNINTGLYYEDSSGQRHQFTHNASFESSDPSIVKILKLNQEVDFDARAPGTATITVSEDGVYGSFTVKVVEYGLFIEHTFPKSMKIDKGSFENLDGPFMIWACTKKNGFQEASVFIEDNRLTASNSRISVAEDSIAGKKAGKVILTLTVTDKELKSECPDIYGKKFKIKVTVEEGPKAEKTKVLAQEKRNYKSIYKDAIWVDFIVGTGLPVEYEYWYSTKKTSGYKRGETIKLNDPLNEYSKGDIYSFLNSPSLKPNTKYYVKIRGRYQDDYHSRKWSAFSKPVVYWTAAKPLSDSKVTFNQSSHTASWPKVKGAKGYTYTIHAFEFVGYNIFGQELYDVVKQTKVCKKNKVTVPAELSNTKVTGVEDIRPIMKHGKYYYVDGSEMSKKMSSYVTDEEYHRWVND